MPTHLREGVLRENHGGVTAGHFSGSKLYKALCRHWWWPNLYRDVVEFCRNCAECSVVSGSGRRQVPPLHPIPVQRPFQILGVDIMELPTTAQGNRYVIVFQDFFTKWPFVFPAPDQKAIRIARLLTEEVFPVVGVPEALLSDRGANLLAHVMQDVCGLLGITKLNTTAYHPQCNGMVERMNRILKATLRKHAAKFGPQWDRYLPGVLWAYRNMPHESTKEKPSFLMFGVDCRSPTEAALLPATPMEPTEVDDYREELILSLSSARKLAAANIRSSQHHYKKYYDRKARAKQFFLGDWVLVRFPQEESGRQRKLSRPWHGPYRITELNTPDVTVVPVYFPEKGSIQVHQTRVCPCPSKLPAGFYWYGGNRRSPGKVPKWLHQVLGSPSAQTEVEEEENPSEVGDVLPLGDLFGEETPPMEDGISGSMEVDEVTPEVSRTLSPPTSEPGTHERKYPRRNRCRPDWLMYLKTGLVRDELPLGEGVM